MLNLQRNEKNNSNIMAEMQDFLRILLDYAVCVYILLMLVVFPFYFVEGYAHIGTDKATFFCKVSIAMGKILLIPLGIYILSGLVGLLRQKREKTCIKDILHRHVTVTDFFALLYCIALVLSYICSDYRENALWGAKGWYMGLVPQLILMLIYFLISRLWKPRKWMLLLVLPVSAIVFLLGCLNRFGVYPLEMAYANPQYISTIGNMNWYCGYAVSVSFLGVVLLWLKPDMKLLWKLLLMLYTALSFVSLVLQGSESGLVALAVVFVVMFCFSVENRERMLMFWQEMLLFSGSCLTVYIIRLTATDSSPFQMVEGFGSRLTYGWIPMFMTLVSCVLLAGIVITGKRNIYPRRLFVVLAKAAVYGGGILLMLLVVLIAANTIRPGSIGVLSDYAIFTFDLDWGSNRGATWWAGWSCFADQNWLHRLVGVGPDCMAEYIYGGENAELLVKMQEVFGAAKLTNAHNEWLTVLINTGIPGLIGFGGMMLCGIRSFIRERAGIPVVCASGFCLLAYTVNNIFSFQQSMGVGTIFVIFGMGRALLRKEALFAEE